ncbi:PH domain leucine-rich repeat-containing protein phosphatase 2 [Gadus macrocephalus]|uniref:PH domain leucine-rich repeat-containing protein phosphatase 2 n=1 Tax=Gadus macrocephalus TaxID=80720 RepID=UPI0028CBBC6C|nr:PH domain leucine-rich repeat-containing protein phosphatase 2 [Gadus macrocephalus]
MRRMGSRGCTSRKTRFGSRERDWLKGDTQRGCVCLYGAAADPQPAGPGPPAPPGPQADLQMVLCSTSTTVEELLAQRDGEALYVQLHGDLLRRLGPSERPLQMVFDYLSALGFREPARVQQEANNSDLSCMIRFYSERPVNVDQRDRALLRGVFSVRKGKTQLHKWAERQVILCGTCLTVASVKDREEGKMHILPLVGGKVEEVRRRQHCLMFSSAGPQAQTYFVNFDSLADYQRWYRQASKVVSQTVCLVDLSCYNLEAVPEYLFYSQDITHLNLRHNFMTPQGPGGLLNLPRFSQLKSLNLSHNRLGVFPGVVCEILTLTELNLSCNGLKAVSVQIANLQSLQTLSLEGNDLSSLPEELGGLSQLSSLGLSFNDFPQIPAVLRGLSGLERLGMAGNRVERLELCVLATMSRVKNVDLRLNGLRWVTSESPEVIGHVTQLDLRDNGLASLDLSPLGSLETLHCQRNRLQTLTLSGLGLRTLQAASNRLNMVNIYPVPNQLTNLDLSRNQLEYLPDWVCDSRKMEVLDIAHNALTELPSRLLNSMSLRRLLAGNNLLQALPELLDHVPLEALDLQHNRLSRLPHSLFCKALNLKYLNVSANTLETIPPSSQSEESLSTLQELYLTGNNLSESVGGLLVGHPRLRVLHLAYNQLLSFPASKLSRLEQLEELNLSGNRLRSIPSTVARCPRLHTLVAHSNLLSTFPEILSLPEIKYVDLSGNELSEVVLSDPLPPSLQELDLTGNSSLVLEPKTLNLFSHITTLKLDQRAGGAAGGAPALWSHGYSETSGQRNKLCVSVLAMDRFGDGLGAVYGLFDGDRNEEVPRLLQCTMGDVLSEELQHSSVDRVYMSNTFLTSHRKLGMAGQKLGASALLCYIHREPSDPGGGHLRLTVANVGSCQAVLCRDGRPLVLSKVLTLESCPEEMERVKNGKSIITEDNKVSGVTGCSRLLGCSYLSPWVLPDPWVHTERLCSQDRFLILGNRALFQRVSPREAVRTAQTAADPAAAARKLCSLAQSYGCRDNLGALVVALNLGEDSCTCCRPHPPATDGGAARPAPPPPPPGGPPAPHPGGGGGGGGNGAEPRTSEPGSEAGPQEPPPPGPPAARPERLCSLHPAPPQGGGPLGAPARGPGGGGGPLLFQRQPPSSAAHFPGGLSDNGLDSDDEGPLDGVTANGRRMEVEADIHCCAFQLRPGAAERSGQRGKVRRQNSVVVSATNGCLLAVCGRGGACLKKSPSASSLGAKKLPNGSVVAPQDSHNLIEVALEAPRKKSGYFTAPAQPDPEDQLVVPPGLEQAVREQLRAQGPGVPGAPGPSTAPPARDPVWDPPHARAPGLVPLAGPARQEVYDTAL